MNGWMNEWMDGWMDGLTNWLTDWLTDWSIEQVFFLRDWLIVWLVDWLTGWWSKPYWFVGPLNQLEPGLSKPSKPGSSSSRNATRCDDHQAAMLGGRFDAIFWPIHLRGAFSVFFDAWPFQKRTSEVRGRSATEGEPPYVSGKPPSNNGKPRSNNEKQGSHLVNFFYPPPNR